MKQRLNVFKQGQNALKTLYGIGNYLKDSVIEKELQELIEFRVSQINGCIFCLGMHYKDAREVGVTEQALYGLNAWREATFYTERERAALAWAEALTKCEVSDALYSQVSEKFSDEEMIDLALVVASINTWNRMNIAFTEIPESFNS